MEIGGGVLVFGLVFVARRLVVENKRKDSVEKAGMRIDGGDFFI